MTNKILESIKGAEFVFDELGPNGWKANSICTRIDGLIDVSMYEVGNPTNRATCSYHPERDLMVMHLAGRRK